MTEWGAYIMNENIIGRNVRMRRERLGLDQKELAERVGLTNSTICRIEGGKRTPGIGNLGKIARALGCAPDELLREGA